MAHKDEETVEAVEAETVEVDDPAAEAPDLAEPDVDPADPDAGKIDAEEPDDSEADARAVLSSRIAAGAFAVYLVVAGALLLFHFGDGFWFSSDDWGFLDGRDLFSPDDLMRPQNGHWVTLPIVAFQVNYRLFGLRSFIPYQLVTVLLHLTLCVLIRVVMRRAGVGPWIATVAAGSFVLFGSGYENLMFPLQISLVGSLVFGILQLLLADHDGKVDWRDGLALLAGVCALMSSSVGVVMVAIVGTATLMRRGWRAALVQTVPLGAVFATWYVWQSRQGLRDVAGEFTARPDLLIPWVRDTFSATLVSIGGYPVVAIALLLVLIAGGALAIAHRGWSASRRTLAAPIALFGGALVLALFIGTGRATLTDVFPGLAEASRYQAMTAALVLPAIAVGAAELIRRQRVVAPVLVILLLLGVPANIAAFDQLAILYTKAGHANQRAFLLSVVKSPYANDVDPDLHPDPDEFAGANVTLGFLRHAAKIGRLPDAPPADAVRDEVVATRLRVSQSLMEEIQPEHTCRDEAGPFEVDAERGDQFVIETPVLISIEREDGTSGTPVPYNIEFAGPTLTSQLDQTFTVGPTLGATKVTWCPVG